MKQRGAKMIQLIVSDLDGTLLNNAKKISERTLRALKAARAKGIKLCMASGRYDEMMSIYSDAVGGCDYLLSCNGAMVKNEKSKEVLFSACITSENVGKILNYFKMEKLTFMMYGFDTIYYERNQATMLQRIKDYETLTMEVKLPKKLTYQAIDLEGNLNFENIIKIVAYEKEPEVIQKIRHYVDEIAGCCMDSTGYGIYGIFHESVSKKRGIDAIKEELKLTDEEVIIFGDWDNDLSMFESGGICVGMANASILIKEKATFLTASNEEDGVAIVIEKLLNDEKMIG